jgi:hypothetical protein
MYEDDQRLDYWVDPLATQTLSIGHGNDREDVITVLYRAQTITDEPQCNPPPPVDPSRFHNRPAQSLNPYAFQMLLGYHGERNDEGRFECFGDCYKGRLGCLGFERRSNLLVHLRSCHGQNILKYDREESQKIRAMHKRMLLAGANE